MVDKLLAEGFTQARIARMFGISKQAVNQIINRHKTYARQAVKKAVESGQLVKSSNCQRCDSAFYPIQAHHPDHNKPLEVIWLCTVCHYNCHTAIRLGMDYQYTLEKTAPQQR